GQFRTFEEPAPRAGVISRASSPTNERPDVASGPRSQRRSRMNNLVPISPELPAHLQQFRPIEPERMHLRQLFGILLQRARLGLGVAALVFIVVLGAFALKTPTYQSSGSVVIDPKGVNLARAEQPQGWTLPPDTSAVDTQVEVLRSHALAERVV